MAQSYSAEEIIQAGDMLVVEIARVESLSGSYDVNTIGFVVFPLIGAVDTRGQTPYSMAKKLMDLYGKDYLQDPYIRVSLVKSISETVRKELNKNLNFPQDEDLTSTQNIQKDVVKTNVVVRNDDMHTPLLDAIFAMAPPTGILNRESP
ncbi:MAG: polysaccharide biosynthesis/export family protein [Maricaulaceae bacterium]